MTDEKAVEALIVQARHLAAVVDDEFNILDDEKRETEKLIAAVRKELEALKPRCLKVSVYGSSSLPLMTFMVPPNNMMETERFHMPLSVSRIKVEPL